MSKFNKALFWASMAGIAVGLCACAMTNEQVEALAKNIGDAAQTGATIAAPVLGIDGGAVAGLAGAIGTGLYVLSRFIIKKFIQIKPKQ